MIFVLGLATLIAGALGRSLPLRVGEWLFPILRGLPEERARNLFVAMARSQANSVCGIPGVGFFILWLIKQRQFGKYHTGSP